MNAHYQRAAMLVQQDRYEMAEKELQQSLLQDPNDSQAMSLLAICLSVLKRYDEADEAAASAIALSPDSAYSFCAASIVSLTRNSMGNANAVGQFVIITAMLPMVVLVGASWFFKIFGKIIK